VIQFQAMRWHASVLSMAVLVGSSLATSYESRAFGAEPPKQGGRIKSAAEEFDEGRRAFLEEDYASAAVHFENAYHDAPRPEPLRHAIRSRVKAGDTARAASLAEHARARYPSEVALAELAKQILDEATPKLFSLTVLCDIPCAVAVDGRLWSLDEAKETKLYLEPGTHALVVSFSDDRNVPKSVTGTEAGRETVNVKAPPIPPKPKAERIIVVEKPKPLSIVPFIVGAGVTAAAGGFTAWSYLDAKANPGEDAVRRDCVGLGEECTTWQDAKAGELRTNVGIFATAGLGIATAVVGLFFTRWSGQAAQPTRGYVMPLVGADGRSLGLGGAF